MKTILCSLLFSLILVYSGNAQTTDSLKVASSCAKLSFEDSFKPFPPDSLKYTPKSDTLILEFKTAVANIPGKYIAVRKISNDTISVDFVETSPLILPASCYAILNVKMPATFVSQNKLVLKLKGKFYNINKLPTEIQENQKQEEVLFFPNPTKYQVFINKNKYSSIIVRNALGQEVLQTPASVTSLDLGAFEVGVYYLTFLSDQGAVTKMIYKY